MSTEPPSASGTAVPLEVLRRWDDSSETCYSLKDNSHVRALQCTMAHYGLNCSVVAAFGASLGLRLRANKRTDGSWRRVVALHAVIV